MPLTPEEQQKIDTVAEVLRSTPQDAVRLLNATNWNVEEAVALAIEARRDLPAERQHQLERKQSQQQQQQQQQLPAPVPVPVTVDTHQPQQPSPVSVSSAASKAAASSSSRGSRAEREREKVRAGRKVPTLVVNVVRARKLKHVGAHSIEVEVEGFPYKTQFVEGDERPVFQRAFEFTKFQDTSFVRFTVYHQRMMFGDKRAAEAHFSLSNLGDDYSKRCTGWITLEHKDRYAGELLCDVYVIKPKTAPAPQAAPQTSVDKQAPTPTPAPKPQAESLPNLIDWDEGEATETPTPKQQAHPAANAQPVTTPVSASSASNADLTLRNGLDDLLSAEIDNVLPTVQQQRGDEGQQVTAAGGGGGGGAAGASDAFRPAFHSPSFSEGFGSQQFPAFPQIAGGGGGGTPQAQSAMSQSYPAPAPSFPEYPQRSSTFASSMQPSSLGYLTAFQPGIAQAMAAQQQQHQHQQQQGGQGVPGTYATMPGGLPGGMGMLHMSAGPSVSYNVGVGGSPSGRSPSLGSGGQSPTMSSTQQQQQQQAARRGSVPY
ncbi:unnamed protein product [Vitrella brassicaformis CCMP3155]|uniref:C2 domain-containing protein n=1 Tax=Vitrella brassicaformis (strain CCMP3155) TaxID=1169540 RepID=A0A0G4EXF0_VITBC|nr:unnamed protein product [Vitrella brassicaformis CCMP3155]|eukprot:CEM03366.1 unnamed protein product [Vitrella brassicaformis CCMP3155]